MTVAHVVLSLLLVTIFAPLGVAKILRRPSLIGAAISHTRAGDGIKDVAPPLWLGPVSAATAVLAIVAA